LAVSVVNKYLNSLCEDHWNAIICILKYIKGSLGKRLLYGSNNHERVVCYSNADWARSLSDRRSTSIFCVGNFISWTSMKQSVIVRYSAEAQYRAMAFSHL